MADLFLMALVLVAFLLLWALSNQRRRAVDPRMLANIVNGILREYRTDGMFSLAVRIPDNQNQNLDQILQQVFRSYPGYDVRNAINNDEVYTGDRVVAAKVLPRPNEGADHAESRVVANLHHLFNRPDNNDLLLFYVYASPCVEKCLNSRHHENILQRIQIINRLRNRAFVFQKPFRPSSGEFINTDQERIDALQRLGNAIGRENIFRYDGMQCIRCFIGGQVDPRVIDN